MRILSSDLVKPRLWRHNVVVRHFCTDYSQKKEKLQGKEKKRKGKERNFI